MYDFSLEKREREREREIGRERERERDRERESTQLKVKDRLKSVYKLGQLCPTCLEGFSSWWGQMRLKTLLKHLPQLKRSGSV